MGNLVSYQESEGFVTITMDDGKVNAMSVAMMGEINDALDQAEKQLRAVILTGRPGVFSAGFDLAVFKQGPEPLAQMLRAGARLNERILSFPLPVVAACSGHGIAMGSFLLMCADYRIGTDGAFKIGMNEVAIGMTLPFFAIEIARQRLAPAFFNRATILAEMYAPQEAIAPGFLDRVVSAEELLPTAREVASAMSKLDMTAHKETKRKVRRSALDAIRASIESELGA